MALRAAVPTLSVVVTTRDRVELANRAIRSALNQTITGIEVIVVDDGSREPFWPAEPDSRIKLVRREQSCGVCAARNVGLRTARGEWVAFLDDDDELLPCMAEVSLQAARDSSLPLPVAVLSTVEVVDEVGAVTITRAAPTLARGCRYFLEDIETGSFQVHNSLVAPRWVIEAIGAWDEQIRAWEHDDFFLRLNAICSLQGAARATYRLRSPAQGTFHLSASMLDRAEGMKRTHEKHRHAFAQRRAYEAKYLGTIGITYLRAGCWRQAVAATTRSLLRYPTRAHAIPQWLQSLAGPAFRRKIDDHRGRRRRKEGAGHRT
jgi:glycosyltransferase involved in cell wall biosynthesis